MDAAAVGAVLAAVAAGGGEALSSKAWEGLAALVRRPFRDGSSAGNAGMAPSGEEELAALAQAPADEQRAVALAEVLVARADANKDFAASLASWLDLTRQVRASGDVSNTVSGGTQHGSVVQGRDFSNLTFGTPPPSPPPARGSDAR